jgi:hypothetical protein
MAQHYDIQNFRKDNPNFDKWFPKLEKSIQHWLKYLNLSHMKSMCLENNSIRFVNKNVTVLPQEYLWEEEDEGSNIVFRYTSPIKTRLWFDQEDKVCDNIFEVHGLDREIKKIYLVA